MRVFRRKPPGTSAGGEFAEAVHAEPDASLVPVTAVHLSDNETLGVPADLEGPWLRYRDGHAEDRVNLGPSTTETLTQIVRGPAEPTPVWVSRDVTPEERAAGYGATDGPQPLLGEEHAFLQGMRPSQAAFNPERPGDRIAGEPGDLNGPPVRFEHGLAFERQSKDRPGNEFMAAQTFVWWRPRPMTTDEANRHVEISDGN